MTGDAETTGFPPETGQPTLCQQESGVVRYRKKPVTVETMTWTGDNWDAIRRFAGAAARYFPALSGGDDPHLDLWNSQEHAWIPCPIGHSVVKSRLGEFYPISPAAIAETYEPAEAPGDGMVLVSREDLRMILDVAPRYAGQDTFPVLRKAHDRLSAAAEVTR